MNMKRQRPKQHLRRTKKGRRVLVNKGVLKRRVLSPGQIRRLDSRERVGVNLAADATAAEATLEALGAIPESQRSPAEQINYEWAKGVLAKNELSNVRANQRGKFGPLQRAAIADAQREHIAIMKKKGWLA
jgi:hypothetical protein